MERMGFQDRSIGLFEIPRWSAGQFRRELSVEGGELIVGEIVLPEIDARHFVDQNGGWNFREFDSSEVVRKTGYDAITMSTHGCGISSLHMALSALSGREYLTSYPNVGSLAVEALSMHRNDMQILGRRIKRGTPVFNTRVGWYHDALVYIAENLGGVRGFRMEDIKDWNTLGLAAADVSDDTSDFEIIASLNSKYWRVKGEPTSVLTHMVITNGFKFSDNHVDQIRIVDPYVLNGSAKINKWVKIDDDLSNAFTGRAIFLIKKNE